MLPTETATEMHTAATGSEPALPLELLELELSLDGFAADENGFADAVREAAGRIGGDFLFELPASGLAENCLRIAALRAPATEAGEMRIVFALLDADGTSIRVEDPGEKTEGLKRFAEAFIGVLERI